MGRQHEVNDAWQRGSTRVEARVQDSGSAGAGRPMTAKLARPKTAGKPPPAQGDCLNRVKVA